LLWDSDPIDHRAFVRASTTVLPFAMRERRRPAGALIAATFPTVYRELQHEGLPSFLPFVFLFLDWDRSKIARQELAEAFSRSDWCATDVALAAARAGDPERILKHVARRSNGPAALSAIDRDIGSIPMPWRQQVQRALQDLGSGDGSWLRLPLDL
jgi:hypothetical protein